MYNSRISVAQLARASADALRLRSEAETKARGTQSTWTFLGPETVGGRLLDIALDPGDGNTLYVGSANGGVWKTTDGGSTFHSVWPLDSAPAVGALAMTSTGRLYAGTGEAGPGGGSITYGNKGVFVSDDGGRTWDSLGLRQSERISRVAIDPSSASSSRRLDRSSSPAASAVSIAASTADRAGSGCSPAQTTRPVHPTSSSIR